MQLVSLFFVFFLVFANIANSQNFFTGDYTRSDLNGEKRNDSSQKNVEEKQKNHQTPNKVNKAEPDRYRKVYWGGKSEPEKDSPKNDAKDNVSPELKNFPPIPLDGKSAVDDEDVYNPKNINLPPAAVHDVNFFMNDKKWEKKSDSDGDVPEKKKALYIEYIPSELKILVGGLHTCTLGIKLSNRSGYKIRRVRLKYIWKNPEPDPETGEYREHHKELVYTDVEDGKDEPYYWKQPGETLCKDYASVKFPRVKVESCIIEGKVMTQLQCAKLIKLKK